MKGVPVLMYHALENEDHPAGATDPGEQLYILPVRQFREQMEYLRQEGFQTFLLEELLAMDCWLEKSVVLTFDDGHESNYTLALPLLKEFGFKADFFITTDWIGTPNYLTEEQVRELSNAGMGIGSHGVSHAFLSDLSAVNVEREMLDSRERLASIICKQVTGFSVPGGRSSGTCEALARKNKYRFLATSSPGLLTKSLLVYCIPRIAVRYKMLPAEFASIVNNDVLAVRRLARRSGMLGILKKLIGNRFYESVRALLLRDGR
ncbi:MAG: polysaccharide deacetylase family protein [Geobacteraceae bacterium]|nr:polysaccharide deacetylase family protein [Geobacteraceae bacterium]